MALNKNALRRYAFHYKSYQLAMAAGLTLGELDHFAIGALDLTEEALQRLARVMGVERFCQS